MVKTWTYKFDWINEYDTLTYLFDTQDEEVAL